MTFAMVGLDLLEADLVQFLLVGLAEIDRDTRHRRQDQQFLDAEHVGDREGDLGGLGDRRQLDQPDAVTKVRDQ